MKTKHLFSLACCLCLVSGCTTYRGGAFDEPYDAGLGQGSPQPAASPSFRPGLNRHDPRDAHFTTRPQPEVSPPVN